jgi:hypothetical protein
MRGSDDTREKRSAGLLTFICLAMTYGPPLVVFGGVLVYQWSMIRSGHATMLNEFNDAVREWNRPSRTHEAFVQEQFYASLHQRSTLPAQSPSILPRVLTASHNPDQMVTGVEELERWQPLKYWLVLPGQGPNATGIPLRSKFEERLTLGLQISEGRGAGTQRRGRLIASLAPAPTFRIATRARSSVGCRHAFGEYDSARGLCTERQVISAICLKVRLLPGNAERSWAVDNYGGGAGCDARHEWQPIQYRPVFTGSADTYMVEIVIPVVVRAAASPYIAAMRVTDGTLNFESTRADKLALGSILIFVGCAMSYPWCVMCKRKRKLRRLKRFDAAYEEEQMDLLRGKMDRQGADGKRMGRRSRRYELSNSDAAAARSRADLGDDNDSDTASDIETTEVATAPFQPPASYASFVRSRRASAGVISTHQYRDGDNSRSAGSNREAGEGSLQSSKVRPRPRRTEPPPPAAVAAAGASRALEAANDIAVNPDANRAFVDMATALGVDLASEEYLHGIVHETLARELPRPWSAHVDASMRVYYHNAVTHQSTYEHPMLATARAAVASARQAAKRGPVRAAVTANGHDTPNAMARRGVATIWEGYEGEDGDQPATDAEVFGSFFEAPASAETVNGQWDKATEADGIINSFLEEEVEEPLRSFLEEEGESEEILSSMGRLPDYSKAINDML